MGHSQIKDSPFELPLPQQRRVEISGPGVLPIYEADAEKLTISCELRLLEQASSGMKSTLIMPDVSSPVPVKAWMSTKNDKGEIMKQSLNVDPKTWTITFKPPTTPEHTIEIRVRVTFNQRLLNFSFATGYCQWRARPGQSLQRPSQGPRHFLRIIVFKKEIFVCFYFL